MRFALYLGCTVPVRALNYEVSARRAAERLRQVRTWLAGGHAEASGARRPPRLPGLPAAELSRQYPVRGPEGLTSSLSESAYGSHPPFPGRRMVRI